MKTLGANTLSSEITTEMVSEKHTYLGAEKTDPYRKRQGGPMVEHKLADGTIILDYPRKEVKLSDATITTELKALKAVMNKARKVWNVEVGEFSMKDQELKEIAHREQSLPGKKEFWALMRALPLHAALPAMFVTLSGARPIGARRLTWDKIDFDNDTIKLVRIKSAKEADKEVVIPLHPLLKKMFLKMGPKPYGPVFVYGGHCKCSHCLRKSVQGQPIGNISPRVKKALTSIGLPNSRYYDLRHTFATWLVNDGVDLAIIQELLGHESIDSTQKYARLNMATKLKAVKKIDVCE